MTTPPSLPAQRQGASPRTRACRIHTFGPPSCIVVEDIGLPEPGPGEILVKVAAAGVGPWDGWIRSGRSVLPQPLPLTLGSDLSLADLERDHDAVFLGIGLGSVNALGLPGEDLPYVRNAVDFIAELRQTADKSTLAVGRDVVVIGGGMTAVDAAVQSKLLGAQTVTMVYRRAKDRMSASLYEQDHATASGVKIIYGAAPQAILPDAVIFAHETGETFSLKADQVFKAIGQTLVDAPIAMDGRKLGHRSGNVWAGGDCAAGGEDLTVTAVAQGRDAAEEINAFLMAAAE